MRRNSGLANIRILVVLVALAASLAMLPHHRAVPHRPARNPHPPAKLHARVRTVDPFAESGALAWAERVLADAPEWPACPDEDQLLLSTPRDARDAFSHIIAKYGPSARAELGLGKCCLRLGLYSDAVKAFSCALRFRPAGEASSCLRKARQLWQVSREVQPMLPRGSTVLRVRTYPEPVPGRSWLVLAGIMDPTGGLTYRGPAPHTIALSLFSVRGASYHRVWQSGPISSASRGPNEDVDTVDVSASNFHPGPVPQVLIHELYPSVDHIAEHLAMYAWEDGGLRNVGELDSSWGMGLGPLEHGGRPGVFTDYEVGADTSHALEPRWSDVYAWRDGRLQPCDRSCPDMVRESMRQLRRTLADHPRDTASLRYLGAAYDLLGQHHRALACYRASRKWFHPDAYLAGDLADLGHVYDIAGRPALALQVYHAAERECLHEIKKTNDRDERSLMEGYLVWVRRRLAAGASFTSGWVSLVDD